MPSVVRRLRALVVSLLAVAAVSTARGDVIYLSDYTHGVIDKLVGGVLTPFATGLNQPDGLAMDPAGNLYVANYGGNSISKVTPDGVVHPFATGITNPSFLAYSGGFIYASNGAIEKVAADGSFVTLNTNGLRQSEGIAAGSGVIYAVDYGESPSNVDKVVPGGATTVFATLTGSGAARPRGFDLAFDGDHTLAVADDQSGFSFINATTGAVNNVTSSVGTALRFGLSFDAAGNAYTVQTNNSTLYEISPGGTVVASTPLTAGTFYDGVLVVPTPEPAALSAAAASALLLARRRRRM